jgi:2-haloacid dehalogenase
LKKYDLILFDADGTLFDYDRAEGIALQRAFEHHQFQYEDTIRNRYREINSSMWKEFENGKIDKVSLQTGRFQRLLEECNLEADACDFNSIYLDLLSEGGYLLDGALEVCRELSQNCTLAIATNGIARTQKNRLKNSAIFPYIKHIIVSEDAGYQKPHQGFFQYAFHICGHHDKETAIIVGDSLSADIRGGVDFGIDTCWYNPGKITDRNDLRADHEIHDLRELMKFIL